MRLRRSFKVISLVFLTGVTVFMIFTVFIVFLNILKILLFAILMISKPLEARLSNRHLDTSYIILQQNIICGKLCSKKSKKKKIGMTKELKCRFG